MSRKHLALRSLYAKHDRLSREQTRLHYREAQIRERLHQVDEAITLISSDQSLNLLPAHRYQIPVDDLVGYSHQLWLRLFWIGTGMVMGLILLGPALMAHISASGGLG